MMGSVQTCPNCSATVNAAAMGCPGCGYNFATKTAPKTPVLAAAASGQPDRYERAATAVEEGSETFLYSVAVVVFIGAALVLLVVTFFSDSISAVQQTSLFAASAVCGIVARIAQAAKQHVQIMREMKRRK